jgi:hypothetical protein
MNESKSDKRLEFCKEAAEIGYTPQEYLTLCKQASTEGSLADTIMNAIKSTGKLTIGLSLGAGGLVGAGAAYGLNALRNDYPEEFVSSIDDSSALQREKARQLIARYRAAAEDVRRQNELFADSQDPENSDMTTYDDFGGF